MLLEFNKSRQFHFKDYYGLNISLNFAFLGVRVECSLVDIQATLRCTSHIVVHNIVCFTGRFLDARENQLPFVFLNRGLKHVKFFMFR